MNPNDEFYQLNEYHWIVPSTAFKQLTIPRHTADFTEAKGVSLPSNLHFVQVPHHGSRHNVSTSVLDRIVGPRKATNDGKTTKTAFVSAGKGSTTHPRKVVVNSFLRRGANKVATQGEIKRHSHKMPPRENWIAATPLSFSNQVKSWD